jgi:molybdate-binding protein
MIAQQQMEHNDRMAEIEYKLKQIQLEKEQYEAVIKKRQAHPPDVAAIVDMVLAFGLDLPEIMKAIKARAHEIG